MRLEQSGTHVKGSRADRPFDSGESFRVQERVAIPWFRCGFSAILGAGLLSVKWLFLRNASSKFIHEMLF